MRAIELKAPGFAGLEQVELPQPKPAADEILIRLRAASINFRDIAVVMGRYKAKLPLIPLSDGVGIIVEVGADVTTLKAGQRVCPVFAPGWISGPPTESSQAKALGGGSDGVLREFMTLKAADAVPVPHHLTEEEAACLPCAGVTAWSAVIDFGHVKPGDIVLVEGTGGVSLFALQFAKAAGAQVAIISSSDEKLELARAMGADFTVNYKSRPEWGVEVRKLTGGRGVDLVVEVVGAQTLAEALIALRHGGRIAQIGLLSGVAAQLPLQHFLPKAACIQAILVGSRAAFEAMARAVELHGMRPKVHQVYPFSDARTAIETFTGTSHFGKVAIRISD
ncbi:MAG TPA: NAD(P)-dependent alcohol dehydrogenase [Rhizomicrobium sp.]|nr:NAD(P)-dependent alcohol dehydrogenase [Rhizomicrobium sp.]